jgi:hypothetical protein
MLSELSIQRSIHAAVQVGIDLDLFKYMCENAPTVGRPEMLASKTGVDPQLLSKLGPNLSSDRPCKRLVTTRALIKTPLNCWFG